MEYGWRDRTPITGGHGVGYVPPAHEDKPELFAEMLMSAKTMNRERRDMRDIALLVAVSINAIHAYADANGRTSRFLFTTLAKDFGADVESELQEVLAENGREQVNVDPGFVSVEIDTMMQNRVGVRDAARNPDMIMNLWREPNNQITFGENCSKEDEKRFLQLLDTDRSYLFLALFEYLQSIGEAKSMYIEKFPDGEIILVDVLAQHVTPEDLHEILQNYRDLKKQYVRILVDCIENPEKPEYQVQEGGKQTSLKKLLECRMEAARGLYT